MTLALAVVAKNIKNAAVQQIKRGDLLLIDFKQDVQNINRRLADLRDAL